MTKVNSGKNRLNGYAIFLAQRAKRRVIKKVCSTSGRLVVAKRLRACAGAISSNARLETTTAEPGRAGDAAGEDVRSLQTLLRHSNIATTDIYVRRLAGTADPGASLLEERYAHFSDANSRSKTRKPEHE